MDEGGRNGRRSRGPSPNNGGVSDDSSATDDSEGNYDYVINDIICL